MIIHPSIENLIPYRPGRSIESVQKQYQLSSVIKLASNENPLGPSPKALEAIRNALSSLHLYPDASSTDLVEALARYHQVTPAEICLGNGSDELFDLLIRIYVEPGESILVSQGAFNAYNLSAKAHRAQVIEAPLKNQFHIDLVAFDHCLSQDRQNQKLIRMVFIPNINNPTGLLIPKEELLPFLQKWGNDPHLWIVLDEAYHEFINSPSYLSGLEVRRQFSSLIVSRTFSKAYGLAGLRLGYIVAPPTISPYIHRVRKPFHVNRLAQVAGLAALGDQEFVRQTCRLIGEEKQKIISFLSEHQVPFLPSEGNFFMINMEAPPTLVEEFFLQNGIIIRPVDNYGFTTWIRVSIGLPEENTKMLLVLEECRHMISQQQRKRGIKPFGKNNP